MKSCRKLLWLTGLLMAFQAAAELSAQEVDGKQLLQVAVQYTQNAKFTSRVPSVDPDGGVSVIYRMSVPGRGALERRDTLMNGESLLATIYRDGDDIYTLFYPMPGGEPTAFKNELEWEHKNEALVWNKLYDSLAVALRDPHCPYLVEETRHEGIECYKVTAGIGYIPSVETLADIYFGGASVDSVRRDLDQIKAKLALVRVYYIGKERPFIYAFEHYGLSGELSTKQSYGKPDFNADFGAEVFDRPALDYQVIKSYADAEKMAANIRTPMPDGFARQASPVEWLLTTIIIVSLGILALLTLLLIKRTKRA